MSHLMSLITPSTIESSGSLIEDGDCAIILKADGSYRTVSVGMSGVTSETLTDAQRSQAHKMLALSLALQSEQVMTMLMNLMLDETVVDQSKVVDLGVAH